MTTIIERVFIGVVLWRARSARIVKLVGEPPVH